MTTNGWVTKNFIIIHDVEGFSEADIIRTTTHAFETTCVFDAPI